MLPAPAVDDKPTTADGFTSLFNGKDLTGWKMVANPNPGSFAKLIPVKTGEVVTGYSAELKETKDRKGEVTQEGGKVIPLWTVKDGCIVGQGPPSHLFSENGDYTDVHFRVEAKINDKGNSGMYVRAKFEPGFPPGYETQINATGGDPIKTGSLYPDYRTKLTAHKKEITVMNKAAHKPDEFFVQETIIKGYTITILVNGKRTIEYTDTDKHHAKGHFALQGHDPGTVVTFKRVEFKDLSK